MFDKPQIVGISICWTKWKRKKSCKITLTRWWNFKGNNIRIFKYTIEKEDIWNFDEANRNIVWTMMINKIWNTTKEILG